MKTRTIISSVLTIGVIAVTAVVLTVPTASVVTPKAMAQPGPPGITIERLATTLTRVGLTAENLAAVGADAADTTGVVVGMRGYLSGDGVQLYDADQAMAAATAAHDELLRRVQRGDREEQTISDLAAARSALASARQAQESALGAAFEQATSGLTANQRTLLARIHQNTQTYHIPTEIAAATWAEADWLALRGALCNVRQNQTPDQEAQSTVSDAMEISDVATADSNLTSRLDACASAWEDAVQTYGSM